MGAMLPASRPGSYDARMRNHTTLPAGASLLAWLPVTFTILCDCRAGESPALVVWTHHGSQRILADAQPGSVQEAHIAAARGEWEPFQVVLRARGGKIERVSADMSPLEGPGRTIAGDDIRLYREHCVYVRSASYRSDARPGVYPDALLPFIDPYTGKAIAPRGGDDTPAGAKYCASPFDLCEGAQEVLWVDVFVPRDAKAGDYRGALTARGRGIAPVTIPVTLTVWDFELPATPTLLSEFGGFERVARRHDVEHGTEAYRRIERRYAEACAQHRITPPVPRSLRPRVNPDGSLDASATHAALEEYMDALHVNAINVERPPFRDPLGADREKALRFLRETGRYLKDNDWLRGAYAYWIDEPNDAQAYEEVRRWGALLHEADAGIAFLVTEQTKTQDPAWGELFGAVDIWVPLWPLHDEPTAAERRAKGERIWSYTALCQGGQPTPWWQIDFPLLNYRIPLWQSWRYRMEGLLYWTAVFWEQASDPWLDQPSFRGAYAGEGMLLYPGRDAGIEGPIATIRLKNIREGIEDYEYFAILARRMGREAADGIVEKIAPAWTQWEHDAEKVLAARAALAAQIIAPAPNATKP